MRKPVPSAALLALLSLPASAAAQQPPPIAQPSPAAQPPPAAQQPPPIAQPPLAAQPPPPAGYPPPYGYPGPYAYPYPIVLPRTLPFREGATPPPGYRLETQMSRPLVAAGAATLGGAYLVSFMIAGTAVSVGDSSSGEFAPLFIPLAGPFITLGVARDVGFDNPGERPGALLLLFDGVAQVTGAALLVAGLVANERIWVRSDIPRKKAEAPRPEVLVGPRGGALRVRF